MFIEDDYGAALRLAREKRKPLFVEGGRALVSGLPLHARNGLQGF
ncbi:MAG TPA: hypothetical protein VNA24_21185 [Hyalangium sp.]|nr:hypothetical protein [Hyalangium sp.]